MEPSLCGPRQKFQNSLSSSLTAADSLDLGQLLQLGSDHIEPLISESVTFDTLSESSSSSDQIPPFSPCKSPRLSIIGLGDHLKMFSGPLSQLQEPRPGIKPKIIITSPTLPRLKSMFKECLCINKWAECLTDWRAPGHIPWGNTPDHTTSNDKWLPEGSLYSPEDFSRALHQARRRAVYARVDTEQDSCAIVDTSFDKYTTATERMDSGISSGTLTHTELVDIIMRELKDLENFFEGTSQEVVHPEQLTLPSLMISNSHCTFPLSLDSCQSFTLKPPSLADRRGRKPLPPLLLKNEIPSPELSYTGIPTAFLSSPSLYSPKFQDVDLANTPELRIEDMIKNLRLQCSSMTPNTPPADISWNSPSCPTSPMPAHEPIKTSMEPEVVEFAGPTIGSTSFSANNTSSEINSRRLVTLTIPTRRASLSGVKPEVLPKRTSSPHPLLRSSLVKQENFRPKSLKSVRFALSPSEFEKNVASLRYDDVWRSSQNPICYSMVPTIFYDNMDKAETQENDSPQRSLQSGGRYSLGLSRIIKGPIFSGKEHKKAATISTRWEFNEKGNAVRDSTESIQKKSGMPVPLRNILTRFK